MRRISTRTRVARWHVVHHHGHLALRAAASFVSIVRIAAPALLAVASLGAMGCRVASEGTPVRAVATEAPPVRTVTLSLDEAPRVAPAVAVPTPSAPSHALVWTQDGHGHRRTWTVDEAGGVLESEDGVRIAAGGLTWAWKETVRPVKTHACPTFDDAGNEMPGTEQPSPGRGVRVTLEGVGAGEGASQTVITPVKDSHASELEQSVELMSTVGPYLFVRTQVYAYACGAHGGVGDQFVVWDADQRRVVWSSSDSVKAPSQQDWTADAPRAKAVAALAAQEDVKMFADESGHITPSLTEIVPSFGPGARLDVRYQLTAFACYACSDGAWSSYSRSTRVDAPRTPDPLRPWGVPAAGVHAFALAHPQLTVGGWSTLS
jgi:hypothetical protein